MATYKENIVDVELTKGTIHRSFLNYAIGSGDSLADHIGVRVFRNGLPVDLSGVAVQGYFHDPQGNNIAITSGNLVGENVAVVVLPQACYNYDGQFVLAIKLIGGGVTGTVRIVDGTVDNANTSNPVAPTETVPTYQEILALYGDMEEFFAGVEEEFEAMAEAIPGSDTAQVNAWNGANAFDPSAIVADRRLRVSDGRIMESENTAVSGFIPVQYGMTVRLNFYCNSDTYGNAFYDAEQNMISSIIGNASSMIASVPKGAAFFRATVPNSDIQTATIYLSNPWFDRLKALDKDDKQNVINYNTLNTGYRLRVSDGSMTTGTNYSVSDFIPVSSNSRIALNFYIESDSYGHVFYDADKTTVISTVSFNAAYADRNSMTAPGGAAYFRLTIPNTELVSGSETAQAYIMDSEQGIVEQTKWLALGDSITYGVYSTGTNTKIDSTNGWVKRLSDAMGYELNNMGVRGMGYVAVGGNGISWGDVLDDVEALEDTYNLITVALGINDYNTDDVTIAQIETAFDTGVQRILTKFPKARLVVITPFNSNRRGTASTNYCYGYAFSGRTLKEVSDAIKAKCEAVGIECIYASNGFLLNNYNMATLLPDKTHPSNYCHTLIAKNMAHFLLD